MSEEYPLIINQSVAILVDGNNIEMALKDMVGDRNALVDFDSLVPKLLDGRGLNRLIYFREGVSISAKLAERLLNFYHGSVVPCYKSADIPLTIKATQIARKVDTIIILSGDSDYVELVRHLKGEGVRVEIAAVEKSTAQILIDEVERFIPITEEDCYILRSYKKPKNTRKKGKKK
ncbi:MAG: NYN domain-containing protein [Saprospiraceae bacterium]|nr:NYN domain-containing protein [Saprospiraceae bacterium]